MLATTRAPIDGLVVCSKSEFSIIQQQDSTRREVATCDDKDDWFLPLDLEHIQVTVGLLVTCCMVNKTPEAGKRALQCIEWIPVAVEDPVGNAQGQRMRSALGRAAIEHRLVVE